MRSLTFLAAAAFVARAAGDATCADKAAAGLNPPEACVVPYTFPAGTQVGNHSLPAAWLGPAPVCYTQYYQNQLATPTFMPRNSACSAYANRGCCSSEMVQRCAAMRPFCRAAAPSRAACAAWLLDLRRSRRCQNPDRALTHATAPPSIDNEQYGSVDPYPGYGSRYAPARGGSGAAQGRSWAGPCPCLTQTHN
jgi:hypothetical protein